jgi:hypothetical protein
VGRGVVSPEKGGALRTTSTAGRRAALAALFTLTLLGAPLLLPAGQGQATAELGAHAGGRRRVAGSPLAPAGSWRLLRFGASPTVTTSTVSSALTTDPPVTTTTDPPVTTTTGPPVTGSTAGTGSSDGQSVTGVATWYAAAPDGDCASPFLPFGTVLEVVDDATGARTTCTVDDREADNPGRVVDLSYDGFAQLANPSQGVVTVTISW